MSSPIHKYVVNRTCDNLIEQNRYVGGDEVGYRCGEPASYYLPVSGIYLCHLCAKGK